MMTSIMFYLQPYACHFFWIRPVWEWQGHIIWHAWQCLTFSFPFVVC